MPSLVIRQNLSVRDRDTYYSSLWSGSHASSFSSSQARGWLTDMELVGKDGQTSAWTSVKVHKAVICPVFPVLHNFLREMSEPEPCIIIPEVPLKVLSSLVQLVYTGECQLSPETDLPSILNLANDLGFPIHPNAFQFKAKPSDSQNKCAEVNGKDAVSSRNSLNNVGNNLHSNSVGNDSADEANDTIPLLSNTGSGDHSTIHTELGDMNNNEMRQTGKSDVPKYNCEYCEFKCKYWIRLKMHSDEHHKNKNFKCKECDFESSNLLNIKNHNKHVHIGEGNLVCKNCGFRASSVRKMTRHENRVHKRVIRLFKEGKKADSDSGDHPTATNVTEIKKTNKSIVKQIGKKKSGKTGSLQDAKSVVASTNQESTSKSKKVLRAKKQPAEEMLHCHVCEFKSFSKKNLDKHIVKFHGNK